MTQALALLALTSSLSACISAAGPEYRSTEIELYEARHVATVACTNSEQCEIAWRRTEQYIAQSSSTPVVVSDGTTIKTRTATEWGMPYFYALRGLEDDGTRTIRIRGMCRGMYLADARPGPLYRSCAKTIARVERGFRDFVNGSSEAIAPSVITPEKAL